MDVDYKYHESGDER